MSTNCLANTPRRHQFAFSASAGTTYVNRVAPSNFTMKSTNTYAKDTGNNGSLWSRDEDYVRDRTSIAGSVSFAPRAVDMRWALPNILGTAFVGNDIKASPMCPFFRVGHLDSVANIVYNYIDCVTSKATFSSSDSQGGLLQLAWDIEACTSTQSAVGGWPVMTIATQPPFVHAQSVLTIGANARRIKDVSLVIDNQLQTDNFFNSLTRTAMPSDGQMITLTHTSPFDDATDLSYTNLTGGVSASLVYTNGAFSITFTLPNLRFIAPEPEVGARGSRVMNQYTWEASLVAGANMTTAAPLTITLDDTP